MSHIVFDDKSHIASSSTKPTARSPEKPMTGFVGIAVFTAVIVAALWYGYHDFMTSDQRLDILNAQISQVETGVKP